MDKGWLGLELGGSDGRGISNGLSSSSSGITKFAP